MTGSISLIIITYNRPGDLLELLQSLRVQEDISLLKEVLILNNASTVSYDAVTNFIRQNSDIPFQYILSEENVGVSRGRNRLMQLASGELLLVLDDDILFREKQDLKNMRMAWDKPFFREANTAALTYRVIYHSTKEQQRTAFPHKQYDRYINELVFLTSYFTGCTHMLLRSVLDKTGYYPEDFFYGMEEYDLSYRIIAAGYSLGYDNSVTVEHKESPLGRQPNHKKLASQWVNKSKVAWRYLPRIYFFSTAFAWSFEYLKKAFGHPLTWFTSWGKVFQIPFREKRRTHVGRVRTYLQKVNARLWY
ncbi:glycosyltransferase family 2 protein [Ferruginibacter sp.]